jgi:hypothetical protein
MRYQIYGNEDVMRWRIVDDSGKLIAVSAGAFLDKDDCLAVIQGVMEIGPAIEDLTMSTQPRSTVRHPDGEQLCACACGAT